MISVLVVLHAPHGTEFRVSIYRHNRPRNPLRAEANLMSLFRF